MNCVLFSRKYMTVCLHCVVQKSFVPAPSKVSTNHLFDNLESGKRNYSFGKKSGKSLEFWIKKSVQALYIKMSHFSPLTMHCLDCTMSWQFTPSISWHWVIFYSKQFRPVLKVKILFNFANPLVTSTQPYFCMIFMSSTWLSISNNLCYNSPIQDQVVQSWVKITDG